MIIKKFLLIASFVMLMAIALQANAASIDPDPSHTNSTPKTEDTRARILINRLEEIRYMNKSELTRSGKKDLRKEVKEIKKEMRTISGGVYLSVGAIIIVILLLILLL
ncbi:MAG TPA: hypothetical protein VET23_00785 [Chitinophagaceae bacterium]|nr:hypothetical protein [Chitinophagaceae bacterium]